MKKLFLQVIALAVMLPAVAANISDDRSLAPFVYPENASVKVDKPAYMADGLSYLRLSEDGKKVVKVDTRSGKELETVMDVTHTRETTIASIDDFVLSPDGSKLLVSRERKMIYRRSSMAKYYVYEIRTRLLHPLSEKFEYQRAPLFSPDGRMVAFVGNDNNIHLHKIDFGSEVDVTTDGSVDHVINGVPDWVYEEEFTTSVSMAWAPDNQTLCYIKYNESDVPAFSFPLYEGSCEPMRQYALYPGSFTYKYPVAGEPNSRVSVHSYDVDNRKTKNLDIPATGIEYIPRIAYGGSPDRLIVATLNRAQTRMELFSLNPRSNVAKSILVEESDAWLDPLTYEDLTFNADNFVVLSTRSGFTHAYQYTYAGALSRTLTKGDFNVTAYYGSDLKGNHYVQSTATGAINRVVSRIDIKGVMKHITPERGTGSAWFTPAMNFYTVNYSNSAKPACYTLCSIDGKELRVIEDNAAVAAKYADMPAKEFITIPNDEGAQMNAYIIKPSDFSPSRRYPVIMHQYSGPGSQQVLDSWSVDWMQYAAGKGYVVVCVDGRGTGGRGRAWETAVYKNLGHYETLDQHAAARWMARQPYVDSARIGICGWSYGGYETLMAVSSAGSPYAAAVAIAPVTDWRYYDTIYAERYMLTPRENEDGYRRSAPINAVGGLSVPLLIMHGTADDNVHFMNTVQYTSALQAAGKWCDLFIYPNMNHSINGCDARLSVYSRMLGYFDANMR